MLVSSFEPIGVRKRLADAIQAGLGTLDEVIDKVKRYESLAAQQVELLESRNAYRDALNYIHWFLLYPRWSPMYPRDRAMARGKREQLQDLGMSAAFDFME